MIGNITGIGKTTGGSSGNNWVYKKIYKDSSSCYVTLWLPNTVNNVNDLINYMWNNLPYYISGYHYTDSGVPVTKWSRVVGLGCGGVTSYDWLISKLYSNYGLSVMSSYTAPRTNPIDLSLFPIPTTLSVASQCENNTEYRTIDDTWSISNI